MHVNVCSIQNTCFVPVSNTNGTTAVFPLSFHTCTSLYAANVRSDFLVPAQLDGLHGALTMGSISCSCTVSDYLFNISLLWHICPHGFSAHNYHSQNETVYRLRISSRMISPKPAPTYRAPSSSDLLPYWGGSTQTFGMHSRFHRTRTPRTTAQSASTASVYFTTKTRVTFLYNFFCGWLLSGAPKPALSLKVSIFLSIDQAPRNQLRPIPRCALIKAMLTSLPTITKTGAATQLHTGTDP